MHRLLLSAALCCTVLFSGSPIYAAPQPPDIPGWKSSPQQIVPIDPASKDKGAWIRWRYEALSPIRRIDVQLLAGKGPHLGKGSSSSSTSDASKQQRPGSDFPIGFGATYEKVRVFGYDGVLEDYPYVGTALALDLSDEKTLVLESPGLSSADLIRFAGTLLTSLSDAKQK